MWRSPPSSRAIVAGIVLCAVSLGARRVEPPLWLAEVVVAAASWGGALLIIAGLGMMLFLEM